MFSNLSGYEVVLVLLLALFIFGDKLPQIIAQGLRMLRNLRRMAQSATSDLSREFGTQIQLDDLNPRTFVRKHVLSEADQETMTRPLKGLSEDVKLQAQGLEREVKDVGKQAHSAAGEVKKAADVRAATRSAAQGTGAGPAPAPRPSYDDVT